MARKLLYNVIPRVFLLLVLILLATSRVWLKHSSGLRVRITPNTCACQDAARIIMLDVSANDELRINSELVEKGTLARRLSEIYGTRNERVLYLSGDDNVSFQGIVNVIETVQESKRGPDRWDLPVPEALRSPAADNLGIEVRLMTRGAVISGCPENCYNWGKHGVLVVP